MRIIAGKYKGMYLNQPHLAPTRPTTNISKEALFNIIDNKFNFDKVRFLDLFGGTGSLSYEFSSRGCTDITTVELDHQAIAFIRATSERLQMEGHRILQMDVFEFVNQSAETFDIIFAGPPYKMPFLDTLPSLIIERGLIEGKGWFILEHDPKYNFDNHPHLWQRRSYGQTNFSFFTNDTEYEL